MSKKRTGIRSLQDMTTSCGAIIWILRHLACVARYLSWLACRAVTEQTEPAPEVVYAIRVMTTKKWKPRKKRAWAKWCGRAKIQNLHWEILTSLSWLLSNDTRPAHVLPATFRKHKKHMEASAHLAEAALGCKCKVVAIELREVDNEQS